MAADKRKKLDEVLTSMHDVYENIEAIKGKNYAYLIRKTVSLMTIYSMLIRQGTPEPVAKGLTADLGELIFKHAKTLKVDLSTQEAMHEFHRNVESIRSTTR